LRGLAARERAKILRIRHTLRNPEMANNVRPWRYKPPYDILSQYYSIKRDNVSITSERKSHLAEHGLKKGFPS
jgi:hypothetical protein